QNTVSLFDSAPIATAILVQNASEVTVRGLIVDGANNGISACSPDLEGITFQNASGSIERSAVRNFKLGSGLEGVQSGTGILCKAAVGPYLASRLATARSTTIRKTESLRMRLAQKLRSTTTWLRGSDQPPGRRKTGYRLDLALRARSRGILLQTIFFRPAA